MQQPDDIIKKPGFTNPALRAGKVLTPLLYLHIYYFTRVKLSSKK
ncbi:hypothetical protein ES707_12310 [subsurface metagenome]